MSIETSVEELFPARPGGLVDSARQQRAAAAAQGSSPAEIEAGPTPYPAVRVRVEAADVAPARTLTLSAANPVLRLLPYDALRRGSVVLAVDNDVYVSNVQGAVQNAVASGGDTAEGVFYLPAGIAIPFDTHAEMFVGVTTTAASTRVSVLITTDSQP
jgi:hypothetical protein